MVEVVTQRQVFEKGVKYSLQVRLSLALYRPLGEKSRV